MQHLVIDIIQVAKWTILRIQRNQYNPKNYLLRIWSLRSQCNTVASITGGLHWFWHWNKAEELLILRVMYAVNEITIKKDYLPTNLWC